MSFESEHEYSDYLQAQAEYENEQEFKTTMKLETKHIAPYLPYQLNCLNDNLPDKNITIDELTGISDHITWSGIFKATHGSTHIPLCAIKPILRPLSDLTKDIEINNKLINPLVNLKLLFNTLEYSELRKCLSIYVDDGREYEILEFPYSLLTKLLEWNFDVFGLIDQGLAVSYNDVNK